MSKDYGINVNLSAVFHDGGTVDAGLNFEDTCDVSFDCESYGRSLDDTVTSMLTQFIGHALLSVDEITEKLGKSEPKPKPELKPEPQPKISTGDIDLDLLRQVLAVSNSNSSAPTINNNSEPEEDDSVGFDSTISTLDKFLKSI